MPDAEEQPTIPDGVDEGKAQGTSTDLKEPSGRCGVEPQAQTPCQAQEHRSDKDLGQDGRQCGVTCRLTDHNMAPGTPCCRTHMPDTE